MNWSKGLTVKERILLHLLTQASYSDHDEVPESVTQQGIADIISAPRPHVSMALKDLKNKEHLTERVCRVIHGNRKQKVYFLTSSGVLQAQSLRKRLLDSKIKVISRDGEEQLSISQVTLKHHLSLLDVVNQLNADGALDLIKPSQKFTPLVTTTMTKKKPPATQTQPKTELGNLDISSEKVAFDYGYQKQSQGELVPHQTTHHSRVQPNEQFGSISKAQRNYMEYLRDYYPEYYKSYYPDLFGPGYYKPSEKATVVLFFIGYFLMILGVISALYLIITGEFFAVIPLIFLLTFGITTLVISATRLWYFEHWHSKVLNLLIMTCPVMLYVIFFTAIESNLSLYDLGLWLLIIFSSFGLGGYGTFIPLHRRAQALAALGIIIIIDATVSILIFTLTMYYAGFWLLSGVLCVYLSHSLVQKELENLFIGVALGLALGILIAIAYFSSQYNFQTSPGGIVNVGILLFIWILISLTLIIQVLRSSSTPTNSKVVEKAVQNLYASLPIFFGIILIFFGFFLLQFNKLIETVVEFFLGGVVVLYGAIRIQGQSWSELIIPGLFILAMVYTLTTIMFL